MIAFRIHRGFTLIEVLIAVLVLAIGLLGIGAVFPVVVRQQRQAQDTIQGLIARKNAEGYVLGRTTGIELSGPVNDVSSTGSPTKITCGAPHGLRVGEIIVLSGLVTSPEDINGKEYRITKIASDSSFFIKADVSKVDVKVGNWKRVHKTIYNDLARLADEAASPTEWQVPTIVDGKTGDMLIWAEYVPLGERLSPPPFSDTCDPQFVWDLAARYAGPNQLEIAVFVRRIDTGITLGQPSGKKYTLSHVLAGDGIPANYRRVPVGVDSTGRPTLNGTPNYATLQVVDVEPREQGTKLQFPKGMQPGLLAALRQPGQKFVDNTGLVYTVAKADDLDRSTVVLEQPVPPDVIERVENDGLQLRVLVSPQVPAAITVVKVSL